MISLYKGRSREFVPDGDKRGQIENGRKPYKQGIQNNLSPFVPVGDVFIGGSYFSYPFRFTSRGDKWGQKFVKAILFGYLEAFSVVPGFFNLSPYLFF